MNSLLKKIISLNFLRKTKEGKIMYNYKFDDACTDEIMSVCEKEVGQNIDGVINNILKKVKDLGVGDDFVVNNVKFIGNHLNVSVDDAFTDEQLNNYNLMDKEFSDDIDAIQFQLNSLSQQKQRAILDFDIAKAVSITDKIADLGVLLAGIEAEISKVNSVIKDVELDFKSNYDKFVSELNNSDNKNGSYDVGCNKSIVSSYVFNIICEILDVLLKDLTETDICNVFENPQIIDVLGVYYKKLTSRYIDNVGANN